MFLNLLIRKLNFKNEWRLQTYSPKKSHVKIAYLDGMMFEDDVGWLEEVYLGFF